MADLVTKPMLASGIEDIDKLVYPVLATKKLDGIRMIRLSTGVVSRKFKDIPNVYIRNELNRILPVGCDGEIFCPGVTFQVSSGNIMRFTGEPNFQVYVFDYVKDSLTKTYEERMKDLKDLEISDDRVIKLLPTVINNKQELLAYETKCLDEGYEGVILRSPSGPYKCGRATWKSQQLMKLKRFSDGEAVIYGLEEQTTNTNEKTKNALGDSERSSHMENLIPANTLGAFLVRDLVSNVEFRIGTGQGLDIELRKQIWEDKNAYIGKIVKYKHFEIGAMDKPRLPIFLAFRDPGDMD